MNKAYAYLRASTDRQDASVPAQRQAISQFCEREQIEIVQWFEDDGVSGKSFERPGYRRMRALVVGGNPDDVAHIVVWSLSRFTRADADDFVIEKRTLARTGVTIMSATEAIRGHGEMGDSLLSYISAHQNRDFLVKLSKDVTRGLRMLVSNGFWPSVAPLGYNRLVVDSNHRPVVVNEKPFILRRGQLKGNQHHVVLIPGDEDEQSAVRVMFNLRNAGRGLRAIAAELNRRGHHTIKGEPWKSTTVRSCLTNIAYLGHTRYGVRRKYNGIRNQIEGVDRYLNPQEEWIIVDNTHEALVPTDLFQAVKDTFRQQEKRASIHSGGQRKLKLFSSAIVCKTCGAHYQCRPRKRGSKEYQYYECSGPGSGRSDSRCDSWSVNADKLKDFIFGHIQRAITEPEFETALKAYLVGRLGQLIRGDVLDTKQIDKDIQTVQEKKGRIVDAIGDGLLDRRDPTVAERLRAIDDELLMLTTRRQEVLRLAGGTLDPDAIAAQIIEQVRDVRAFLGSQAVEEQRRVLFAFCKRIVADAERREIVVEADLSGLAQNEAPPGFPAGLSVADLTSNENAQPAAGACCAYPAKEHLPE